MARRRLFLDLAAAAGYTGVGMLLGYVFSNTTTNTALWVGILLVLLGAVLLGMFISARHETTQPPIAPHKDTPDLPSRS